MLLTLATLNRQVIALCVRRENFARSKTSYLQPAPMAGLLISVRHIVLDVHLGKIVWTRPEDTLSIVHQEPIMTGLTSMVPAPSMTPLVRL